MQSHLPKVLTVCQRRAAPAVGRGPEAYLSGVAVQPASCLCCSVQSSGRSSSVSRVAVSATGCRPCKIASISSGLKKARPMRDDRELYCTTTAKIHYATGVAHAALGKVTAAQKRNGCYFAKLRN